MKKTTSSIGKENLPSIELIHKKLNTFLDNHIYGFIQFLKEYHKVNNEKGIVLKDKIEQEDDITNPIVINLNCIDNSIFYFNNQHKTPETNSTTDIGVFLKYSNKTPFCFIEAKRLPTPIGTNREETEYVCYKAINKQGGIERFKTQRHGGKENLSRSIMFGYVQDNDFNYWCNKVNFWIGEEIKKTSNKDINWEEEDKLIIENSFSKPNLSKYTSTHTRIKLSKIKLTHYWIDLN